MLKQYVTNIITNTIRTFEEEINRAINPTLYDHPLASITSHVTASIMLHWARGKAVIGVLTCVSHLISTSSGPWSHVLDLQ